MRRQTFDCTYDRGYGSGNGNGTSKLRGHWAIRSPAGHV